MLSYLFWLCWAIGLAKSKRVQPEELKLALDETTDSIVEGLEDCSVVKSLVGGAQAQTVQANLRGDQVVIKIDVKAKMENEAGNYELLSTEDWSRPLLPTLYESGELGDGKVRLVLEWLQKPEEGSTCGWTTLGEVSMSSGGFVKISDVSFEVASALWTSLLQTLLLLKEHNWHHCDFHPYNIMVDQCTAKVKLIDWERSGKETNRKGYCRKGGDLMKLSQSFGVLFNRKDTNVLQFLMSGARDPESFVQPGLDDKVLATAIKVLASDKLQHAADEEKVIKDLLHLWAGGEAADADYEADRISAEVAECVKGKKVAREYCCQAACASSSDASCFKTCKA